MSTIIGISGPSSSGKTTLARLLRSVLHNAGFQVFILHEDDFYVTDKDIPVHHETGFQDWDCLESIDSHALEAALTHIKQHGQLPPKLQSKEDQNTTGKVDIIQTTIGEIQRRANALDPVSRKSIALVDGFLLYTPSLEPVYRQMDVKIFLPLSQDLMVARRAARSGYVTLEGFWEDPPGYVEKVVWPNYAKDHAYLFQDGNVQGALDGKQLKRLQIDAAPASAMQDMNVCFKWAWGLIEQHIGEL